MYYDLEVNKKKSIAGAVMEKIDFGKYARLYWHTHST